MIQTPRQSVNVGPVQSRERGAVATLFVVLLAGTVLLGLTAISLDVGRLLAEKGQLQSAADAAALSLARSCDNGNCVSGADGLQTLVDRNSSDGVSGIQSECSLNIPTSSLPTCGTASGELADCAPLPGSLASLGALPYVEVRTRTQTPDGAGGRSNSLKNWLAGLAGAGNATSSAGACARAAIGTPADGTADVPIAFSGCDWQHATGGTTGGGGGSYYASPVYNGSNAYGYGGAGQPLFPAAAAPPPAQLQGQEVILLTENPPGGATPASPCPSWQGHALPGGFGSLETTSDPCVFVEYPHHWMKTDTGNNTSCNLNALVGKVISLPIFDCTANYSPGVAPPVTDCLGGNGSNAYFHRAGYASFYLSGYSLNVTGGIPNKRKSLVSGNFPCNGGDRCISGWFVKGSLTATAISGPPTGSGNFGANGVVPAG